MFHPWPDVWLPLINILRWPVAVVVIFYVIRSRGKVK